MAEHLARIIGTEEDRVNCPFYWKIGACRHGDQCSRSHYKPTSSQTLVLRHMYQNPPIALAIAEGQDVDDELADKAQDHFELFYEEVFEELANYGQIEEMVVCDNIGDHMIGNLYVKYASEDDAEKAVFQLRGRYYAGRMIEVEFSPVTDFREARCRQFVDGQCSRGGYCNFMHMKHVPRSLKRKMIQRMFDAHSDYKKTAAMFTDDPSRGGRRQEGGGPRQRDYSYTNRSDTNSKDMWYQRSRARDYPRDYDRSYYNSRHDSRRGYARTSSRDRANERRRSYDDSSRNNRDSRSNRPNVRQSSQERRAMIAQWNQEASTTEEPTT